MSTSHGYEHFPTSVQEERTGASALLAAYLLHVAGGGDQPPLCPFVKAVHYGDGYWVRYYAQRCDHLVFRHVVNQLVEAFCDQSPDETHFAQSVDITTTVAVFTTYLDEDPEERVRLQIAIARARNRFRLEVLQRGLMLAHMMPLHDDPKGGGQYVSGIPVLMVRRMHRQDHVFMNTEAEKAAYATYFPEEHV